MRAEASRAQEGRAHEKERLAAEARAKAHKTMVAADVARLEADKQRAVRRRSCRKAAGHGRGGEAG